MVEAFLLTCLQANFIIGRVRVHPNLTEVQKTELEREIRIVTKNDCPIF